MQDLAGESTEAQRLESRMEAIRRIVETTAPLTIDERTSEELVARLYDEDGLPK
jgi:hypothetical protein